MVVCPSKVTEGEPLIKSEAIQKSSSISPLSTIRKTNQESTAYNWKGNKIANGNWSALGIENKQSYLAA